MGQILVQQAMIAGNGTAVVILDAHISKYIKDISKIENTEIQTVFFSSQGILHFGIYEKNVNGLDQNIDQNQKSDIYYKFPFQNQSLFIAKVP